MTTEQFEKTFTSKGNKLYVWLPQSKTRAQISRSLYSNVALDLTTFDGKVPTLRAAPTRW